MLKSLADPRQTLLVIFGGTGDLCKRKLLPAAYNLFVQTERPEALRILAIGRREWSRERYLDEIRPWVDEFSRKAFAEQSFAEFAQTIDYFRMNMAESEDYFAFFAYLDRCYPACEKLFYYAVGPDFFSAISKGLQQRRWKNEENVKVVIEKPFGETLEQAKAHHKEIASVFGEDHIYHIDHYLGKEMIQNISALRFDNMIFRSCWNRRYIEAVEISALERVGVETRGLYYDKVGALRDMVQNHLFQILSILAMEEPEKNSPFAVTVAQQNVLQALRPPAELSLKHSLVMGQYQGYRSEPKVAPDSQTDSYAALAVYIDNPRWQDVPFFIRTGKKLSQRGTQVLIHFKKTSEHILANQLLIQIQPDEGVKLSFNIKEPGLGNSIEQVHMDFCQSCLVRAHENTPEAYERLLRAALAGERYLFSQWPQIEFSWRWLDQLIALWEAEGRPLAIYPQNTDGPTEADELLQAHRLSWSRQLSLY